MNSQLVEQIADAVLYEGYLLYPYRPSAVKNQRRFNFGVLVPQSYSEAQHGTEIWQMQTECLVLGTQDTALDVKVRFLHLRERSENAGPPWQEAVERELNAPRHYLAEVLAHPQRHAFCFLATRDIEPLCDDDQIAGARLLRQESVEGMIEIAAEQLGERLFKLTTRILNLTPFENARAKTRDEALLGSFVSTHTILGLSGGEFISLLDPPEEFREAAAGCQNLGAWPVLAGKEGGHDLMLSSPIILYDYPQIAPESAGDLFDGTEIDEILMLRIMTLTDEEKREMRGADERARQILERAETLSPEQWMKLHGAMRGLRSLDDDWLSESDEQVGMASAAR